MKNYTSKQLHLDKETTQQLTKLFPNKPLGEIYAIHYIISRINLCSFMFVPDPDREDTYSYDCYIKNYEKYVKPNLTEEIIEAICDYDSIGADVINKGNRGYNLAKIFGYGSLDKQEAFFEYKEPVITSEFNMLYYVTYQYEKSILPILCGGEKNEK